MYLCVVLQFIDFMYGMCQCLLHCLRSGSLSAGSYIHSIDLVADECKRVYSDICQISPGSGKALLVRCDERHDGATPWKLQMRVAQHPMLDHLPLFATSNPTTEEEDDDPGCSTSDSSRIHHSHECKWESVVASTNKERRNVD